MIRIVTQATLLAAALLVSGCVVVARPHPPPPPPRIVSAQEAVASATYFARSHGLVVDYTLATHLDRHARWHVDIGGAGGRDRAFVTVDGYSGRVVAARLRGPGGEFVPQPPPGASPGSPPSSPPPAGTAAPPDGTPPPEGTPPPPDTAPPPPPAIPPR